MSTHSRPIAPGACITRRRRRPPPQIRSRLPDFHEIIDRAVDLQERGGAAASERGHRGSLRRRSQASAASAADGPRADRSSAGDSLGEGPGASLGPGLSLHPAEERVWGSHTDYVSASLEISNPTHSTLAEIGRAHV